MLELLKEIAFYWRANNVLCMKIHTSSRVVNSLKDEYFEFLSKCKLDVSGRMGNHKVIKECRPRKSKLILCLLNYLMHFKYVFTYGYTADMQNTLDDTRYFLLA